MKITDYIDDYQKDKESQKRRLAKEKSYDIMNYIDGVEDEVDDIHRGDIIKAQSPSIFVGQGSYPSVSAGILSPLVQSEDADDLIADSNWYSNGLSVSSVLQNRASLLDTQKTSQTNVNDVWDGFVGAQREVAIAQEPVDMELGISSRPELQMDADNITGPRGSTADAGAANITENPYVPKPIKKTLEDDDWKAEGAIQYLYEKGYDVYQIQDILTSGTLGRSEERKLVPTRWSITAVDDTVGKSVREDVKSNSHINEIQIHINEFMGNRYWVILTPGQWEFELVEIKESESVWNPNKDSVYMSSAWEGYSGRSGYVEETAGAYYASRLGVLEYLEEQDRQAKALVLREVTDKYWAPVGVWQVRESVRNAFSDKYGTAETLLYVVSEVSNQLPVSKERLQLKSNMMSGVQQSLQKYL